MNKGKVGKRRAAILAELIKRPVAAARWADERKHLAVVAGTRERERYKPSHRAWELRFGPDGAPPAERAQVPVVFVVYDVEEVHDAD